MHHRVRLRRPEHLREITSGHAPSCRRSAGAFAGRQGHCCQCAATTCAAAFFGARRAAWQTRSHCPASRRDIHAAHSSRAATALRGLAMTARYASQETHAIFPSIRWGIKGTSKTDVILSYDCFGAEKRNVMIRPVAAQERDRTRKNCWPTGVVLATERCYRHRPNKRCPTGVGN